MAIYNGTANGDYIIGSEENDEIYGLEGNDWLEGGLGDDIIDGGLGWNRILAGDGNDTIIFGNGVANGGAGIDTLTAETSSNGIAVTLTDTVGYGNLYDSADRSGSIVSSVSIEGVENITGGAGNDYVVGNSSANEITGNEGDDSLRGEGGDDIINGGLGNDYLLGGLGNDTIYGGDGIDNLVGGDGDDELYGEAGNDWIEGGAGADILDGGTGVNTISYVNSDAGININLGTGAVSGGHATGDTVSNFQRVMGSGFDDTITGNDEDNFFYADAGGDIYDGQGGFNIVSYENSNEGIAAHLHFHTPSRGYTGSGGYAEGDMFSNIQGVIGSKFDDSIDGTSNFSCLFISSLGADRYIGANVSDPHTGTYSNVDTVSYINSNEGVNAYLDGTVCSGGNSAGDTISNIHNLVGSNFDDVLVGNDLNNHLSGAAGADGIDGKGGRNTASYGSSNAAVNVNLETGTGTGGHAEGDTLVNIQNLSGSSYDDTLIGNNENNIFIGSAGADDIDGKGGSEVLMLNTTFNNFNISSYITSDAGVNINLETGIHTGGHAEGDTLTNIQGIIGSAYDDVMVGNDQNNYFRGEEGADSFDGRGGYNIVSYENSYSVTVNLATGIGSGQDAAGDTYTNIYGAIGGYGFDRFYGQDGVNNHFYGASRDDTFYSSTGDNIYDGGTWYDTVYYIDSDAGVNVNLLTGVVSGGHAEGDILLSIEGLSGSQYDDILYGNGERNTLYGRDGNDIIYGISTSYSYNKLYGGNGDDIIYGGDTDDIIEGESGLDVLTGGLGNDQFYYHNISDSTSSSGIDTITDFIQGEDLLRFNPWEYGFGSDWTNFSYSHSGGDTILTHNTQDFELHLNGIHELTSSDFLFQSYV